MSVANAAMYLSAKMKRYSGAECVDAKKVNCANLRRKC